MASKKIIWLAALILFCYFFPGTARGAVSLYLYPPSGTYSIGQQFNVYVKIDPGSSDINAAEGVLVFNSKELEVVSVSKAESFFTLWTTEPSFSNSAGKIEFGGGTQKAFSGNGGTIMTISFRPKISVTTQVNFSSGSVLAADGLGTNILSAMQGGNYTFSARNLDSDSETTDAAGELHLPQTASGAPAAPNISSDTHPDPDKWYKNNNVELKWDLPKDTAGIQAVLDQNLNSLPYIYYQSKTAEKNFPDLEDGIWYFHLQFKNSRGWGSIAHRKIQIDNRPPEQFEIVVSENIDPQKPNPILAFETKDATSGIAGYEVRIDQQPPITNILPEILEKNPWRAPRLAPGKHLVIVKAFDFAGNYTLSAAEFEIPAMECPIITQIPQIINNSGQMVFQGTAKYPHSELTVAIKKNGQEIKTESIRTNEIGDWLVAFSSDITFKEGNYQATAQINSQSGGQSQNCAKINFLVQKSLNSKIKTFILDYCGLIVLLAIIIAAIILIFVWAWHKVILWRNRIKRETDEANFTAQETLEALKQQNQEEIDYLNCLPEATEREKEIRRRLQNGLDAAQKHIRKEIDDIENEL